jgi:hypothetical protein
VRLARRPEDVQQALLSAGGADQGETFGTGDLLGHTANEAIVGRPWKCPIRLQAGLL